MSSTTGAWSRGSAMMSGLFPACDVTVPHGGMFGVVVGPADEGEAGAVRRLPPQVPPRIQWFVWRERDESRWRMLPRASAMARDVAARRVQIPRPRLPSHCSQRPCAEAIARRLGVHIGRRRRGPGGRSAESG